MLRETPLSLRSYISKTLLLILFSSCSVPAPSGLVQLRPFEIESKETQRTEFDGLILLGAFELRSRHPHFGGISGLSIGADGRLYAVSDRGYWLSARMRHDSEGALVDLLDWQIKPILTPERTPTDGLLTDAEALASAPDGSFIVGFEQTHRLWRYLPPPMPFDSSAQAIPAPHNLAKAPRNGGLECVTVLPSGKFSPLPKNCKIKTGVSKAGSSMTSKRWSYRTCQVPASEHPIALRCQMAMSCPRTALIDLSRLLGAPEAHSSCEHT